MRLVNQTKNTVLSEDVIIADNPFKRMRGLLGKKALCTGQSIILEPCNSVHTLFMRFVIDIIFVDKNYKVIKIIPQLTPNKITPLYWQSSRVVELPAGILALTNTQSGDQLRLSD